MVVLRVVRWVRLIRLASIGCQSDGCLSGDQRLRRIREQTCRGSGEGIVVSRNFMLCEYICYLQEVNPDENSQYGLVSLAPYIFVLSRQSAHSYRALEEHGIHPHP